MTPRWLSRLHRWARRFLDAHEEEWTMDDRDLCDPGECPACDEYRAVLFGRWIGIALAVTVALAVWGGW